VDDAAVKLLWVAALAALLVLLRAMLAAHVGPRVALAAVLLLAVSPGALTATVWGTAELPFALFLLGAAHGLLRWLADPHRRAGLGTAAACLACAALTKNEGLAATACFPLVAVACAAWWGRAASPLAAGAMPLAAGAMPLAAVRTLLVLVAPALLLSGAWWLVAAQRGLPVLALPPGGAAAAPLGARVALVLAAAGREFVEPAWLFAWPLAALSAAVCLRRVRRARAAGVVPDAASTAALLAAGLAFAQAAACLVALATHEGDLPGLLRITLPRLPWHVLPIALLAALVGLAGGERSRAAGRAVSAPGA
jgi:hypothetical protein